MQPVHPLHGRNQWLQRVDGHRPGAHEEIDVVAGFPLDNKLSGNVVDLCPVGALGDKDFLYKQRVWFLKRRPGVCTGCATGCSIWIEENQDRIYRIKPRENPFVNAWWICNDGRYDYPHVHNPRRLLQPYRQDGGNRTELDWAALPAELAERLKQAGRLAAVLSPFLTVEEAYLLSRFVRNLDADARLVLGRVPAVGTDERFPKGFVISAEKCPNRRGVEAVIAHFAHGVTTFDQFLPELDRGALDGVWIAGGYKGDWIDEATARRFERLKLSVVQDLFPSPLSALATFVLPGAAYAERPGSHVNCSDRLQSAAWAIRPPAGVRTEGSLLWELNGRKGLYDATAVLQEVAREIMFFSAAVGAIPETGVDLRSNLLA